MLNANDVESSENVPLAGLAHTQTSARVAAAKKPEPSRAQDEEPPADSDDFAELPLPFNAKGKPARTKSKATTKTTRAKAPKGKTNVKDSIPRPHAPEYANNQSTSILDLPPEIRNGIWTMAIVQDAPIPIAPMRPFLREPALLAVSEQIRSETMSIWYAENVFEMMGSSPAMRFLRSRTDQQLRSIRSLCITSEKSDVMKQTPRSWLQHLQQKTVTLMREFGSRGFRVWALKFQVISDGELKWMDGQDLQVAGVTGSPDKRKWIHGGPQKGQKVPGSASQSYGTSKPPS